MGKHDDNDLEYHTVAVPESHMYIIEWDGSEYYSSPGGREVALLYLAQMQNYFNNMLDQRGHIFLNEVMDALGMPRTHAGQLVGWTHGHIVHLDPKIHGEGSKIELAIKVEGYILDDLL